MKNLLEHTGIEPGRLHFSWVSSAESTKFVDVVKKITDEVKALNETKRFVKTSIQVE
jgi:coenzyme F420-reducing hydrogenase delta subunit